MNRKIIEISNLVLNKEKHTILDIDTFYLEQGETIVLIGPNGAGKSTLLQILMLLQRPTAGDFYFRGEKVRWEDSLSYRRRMAMVFQEALLLETTVYHNVASGLVIRGFPKEQIQERVKKWLVRLGIEHLSYRSARSLSGGESQRVSLARALVLEPEVIFLDEPFAALDEPTRNTLLSDLADILRDTSVSSIIVTHNYAEIPVLADRAVAMDKGRIVQVATPWEILTRPASLGVASLVGIKNAIKGVITGYDNDNGKVFVKAGQHDIVANVFTPPNSEKVYILLRPEDVKMMVTLEKNEANTMRGRIGKLMPYGNMFTAVVDCGIPFTATISHEQALHGDLTIGRDVWISFSPDRVHLINAQAITPE
ncbi:MAG: sn-glycerol-3-phosphate import ATP-binding protein UgpC [Pelotomaculum sp. PtaB.Bin013]|uniref:ABC transporter ATP-binding protein n=1 Tax=Pelotomaculum isophthalicicum JI TaxID=947010 RepID=A0A9X4H2V8_9FIRM|nr:ABC transporter ATP-binding protein [Pelotomaculum isophthalicicum]MDF9409180.1 ABC transporter ATP-binding protein [Pelotomaculum isophthalicicum JI]OPX90333.1 MAG: sn-glycerol-3-phosphate import ATP-binding protein UgpC [Pelotomaculum sp. PtaB.Bin013]